ncbi:MAG TPA: carboxypeptidase regulatory-like domain-containing protein [Terriglobales bacterium]|nr:carboxypeptidase regulatory-like domain-containing protein [Terriglobales bacterium]
MNRFLVTVVSLAALASIANAGTITGKVAGRAADSVVYVDAISGKTFPGPAKHPVMDQKNLVFQPHVMVVQQGTTVDFLNSDSVSHNVFWTAISGNKKLAHNLGTWPQGQTRSFKFDNPGTVPVLCNVHPEMTAFIVVSPTPYFAQTDSTGNYKIENVPDGAYTVTAWHEGAKPASQKVTVSGNAQADFTLGK